jgi:hypothetical protein
LAGVLEDEPARAALAHVTRLEALLLALALESGVAERRVRLAELVLTLLNGSGHLADAAPGFGDPFDVVHACEHLGRIELADTWDPPHLPFVAAAQPCDERWDPPVELRDQITRSPVALDADGVIAVLGTNRLAAAEEVVRAARPGDQVTIAVVTSDPAEIGRLVRLRVNDLTGCVRRVFARSAWPRLKLVLDELGLVAAAARPVDGAAVVAGPVDGAAVAARADTAASAVHGGAVATRGADGVDAAGRAGAGAGAADHDGSAGPAADAVAAYDDDTEEAIRIRSGAIVARARGRGAGYAVARSS